ncbi:MAG: hypothetical protein CSA66_02950 [Proteobacteria bacterium]|nr:MAG: hypothetical protein CSA66_02950 [Pseudomonadota bacterium]
MVPYLAALGLLYGGSAAAEITNFEFVGIEGVGELSGALNDRLGTEVNAKGHVINLSDCRAYAGGQSVWTVRISPLPGDTYQFAAGYAPPGKNCPTASSSLTEEEGTCYVEYSGRDLDRTTIEFNVDFDELTGGDCDSNEQDKATVYVIIEEPTAVTPIVEAEQIEVTVDLRPPAAPQGVTLTPGDGRFTVNWKDDANSGDEVEYIVYYDQVEFTADAIATVSRKRGVTTTSVSIEDSGLVNGLTYYVRVAAIDEADNLSPLSEVQTVTPQETEDFWERYQAAGGSDAGDFCFIATAAYGSAMTSELGALRAFRDRILMSSSTGRAFVDGYYRWGRFAAAWIADKPGLRAVARVLLVPLVWLAKLALWLSPMGLLFALGAAAIALTWMRRRVVQHILRDVPMEARR